MADFRGLLADASGAISKGYPQGALPKSGNPFIDRITELAKRNGANMNDPADVMAKAWDAEPTDMMAHAIEQMSKSLNVPPPWAQQAPRPSQGQSGPPQAAPQQGQGLLGR